MNGDMNVGRNLEHGPIQGENYNLFWRGWDNLEGGPVAFKLAAYAQGAPANANDFFTATFTNLTVTSIVPEPASIGVLSLGGLTLLARRRRSA